MKEFSQEWWHTISCKPGCANCCPKTCVHLTTENLCDVHPSLFNGSEFVARDNGRGSGCHALPIELFAYGYYCPAITDIMEEQSIVIEHSTSPIGVETIDNFQEVVNKTMKLRGF
jgi:hypothetical protein